MHADIHTHPGLDTSTRRYDALYFGDTGTAVTTLAVCHSMSSGNRTRQQRYSGALARHLNFITDGCQQIPAKYATDRRCPQKGTGWTMGGNNAGAVADGYSNNTLDCLTPYTIAAATCGAAFAELSTIDLVANGPSRTEIAENSKANSTALSIGAALWIADTIGPDGTVPYGPYRAVLCCPRSVAVPTC